MIDMYGGRGCWGTLVSRKITEVLNRKGLYLSTLVSYKSTKCNIRECGFIRKLKGKPLKYRLKKNPHLL